MKALKQEEMVHKLDTKHSPAASQPSRKFGKITRKEKDKGLSTPQTRRCKFCTIHPKAKRAVSPPGAVSAILVTRGNHFQASQVCEVHAVDDGDDLSDVSSV